MLCRKSANKLGHCGEKLFVFAGESHFPIVVSDKEKQNCQGKYYVVI